MAERGQSAGLWLTAGVRSDEQPEHLYLEVAQPEHLLTARTEEPVPAATHGDILICSGEPLTPRSRPQGGFRVGRQLFWSLLDPIQVGRTGTGESGDRIGAERALRRECRRLWERLAWWASLPAEIRKTCRSLLAAFQPGTAALVAAWDALSNRAAGDPVGGWPAAGEIPEKAAEGPAATAISWPGSAAEIGEWLTAPAGLGRLLGRHFTPRSEQVAMAEEVVRALTGSQPLLVEAGTGVGKTLAYLVPLLRILDGGETRAVVSTYTRTLQTQILGADLPLLAPLVPEVKVRLLMGRMNYLCRRGRLRFLQREISSFHEACALAAFHLWLAATEDGMREELTGNALLEPFLPELFDSPEPCSPRLCYEGGVCFVQRARRLAREADLVVVNHSLLMNDLAGGGFLLGGFQHLVVDEAHRLPGVALEAHAVQCDAARPRQIEEVLGGRFAAAALPPLLQELADELEPLGGQGIALRAALEDFASLAAGCLQAYRGWWEALGRLVDERIGKVVRPVGRVRVHDKDETFGPLRPDTARFLDAAAAAGAAFALFSERAEGLPEPSLTGEENLARLAQVGQMLEALHREVRFLLTDPDEDWVTWLEPGGAAGVAKLGATRLEAGPLLRDYWLERELRPIMTSATLAVGEDFGHMLAELGLARWQPPTPTLLVDSPFAYDRQTLLVTPTEFPAPDQAGFATAVADVLAALHGQIGRKTLALFTSYQLLNKVAADLEERKAADPGLFARAEGGAILSQVEAGAAPALLERFRATPGALLLGTASFWEGVDFPGTDLEVLVVTKLPFLVPADPWVEARCGKIQAAGEDAFNTFMVRDAVLRLRQGLGRLIRRTSDRGVIALLDNRLHSKPYGATFLGALPTAPSWFSSPGDLARRAAEFFSAGDRAAG